MHSPQTFPVSSSCPIHFSFVALVSGHDWVLVGSDLGSDQDRGLIIMDGMHRLAGLAGLDWTGWDRVGTNGTLYTLCRADDEPPWIWRFSRLTTISFFFSRIVFRSSPCIERDRATPSRTAADGLSLLFQYGGRWMRPVVGQGPWEALHRERDVAYFSISLRDSILMSKSNHFARRTLTKTARTRPVAIR